MPEAGHFILAEAPGDPDASPIGRLIAAKIQDRRCRFVFPTQVSADSWAEAALDFPGIASLEKSRFLGWDAFLEERRSASAPKNALRADARVRLLWSLAFLAEMDSGGRTAWQEDIRFRPGIAFASSLAGLAPDLDALSLLPDDELPDAVHGLDLARIAQRYREFREENSIYEFSGLPLQRDEESQYAFIHPSLMPGFCTLEKELGSRIRMEALEAAPGGTCPVLHACDTFREEVDAVLETCAHFIRKGLPADDMALSIPAAGPSMQAHLALAAARLGLALDFRAGIPLTRSPAGSLLAALQAAASEGFSARTLRRLLDPSLAILKYRESGLELLAFAESHNVPGASADVHYMSSLWNRSFALCGTGSRRPATAEARLFYDRIRAAALSLSGAKDFRSLRAALHDFMDDFIEGEDAAGPAERMLERIYIELDSLSAWHAHIGHPKLAAGPFDILLLHLGKTRYGQPRARGHIAVYPYHLGLALASRLHFVLDLSQESTASAIMTISRGARESNGENATGRIDDRILGSMDSVSAVFCHAASGLSGYTVHHPRFSRPDARIRHFFHATGNVRASGNKAMHEIRKHGPGQRLDPEKLRPLPKAFALPWFKFTPSGLGTMEDCPFKWFVACLPGMETRTPSTIQMAEGSLLHSLIDSLLVLTGSRDSACKAENIGKYLEWMDEIFPREMRKIIAEAGPALQDALETGYPRMRSRIATLLQREAEFQAEGWNIGDLEFPLSLVFEEEGILLSGRADRIASRKRSDGLAECAVIDYKRDSTPKRGDFLVDEEGSLHDFQLASYTAMLEGQGRQVERAMYWSVEKGKLVVVFGPDGKIPGRNDFEPQLTALREAVARCSARLKEGRFLEIVPSPAACKNCDARPLCRAHFATERAT
jgi:RecB family exonuclease